MSQRNVYDVAFAVNKLLPNKDELISAFEEASCDIFDTAALETERDELQNELIVVSEMIEKAIYENAHIAIDQEEYQKRYDGLRKKYERITKQIEKITETISDKQTRFAAIKDYLQTLRAINEPVQEFDSNMWSSLVDFITVYSKEDIRVSFKDGTEIKQIVTIL